MIPKIKSITVRGRGTKGKPWKYVKDREIGLIMKQVHNKRTETTCRNTVNRT